jgi:hypothetical protein
MSNVRRQKMLRTIPSIEALGEALSCEPRIESEHPEYGVLVYEVEYETTDDRISLSVLPLAQEVNISLVARNPTRIIRLALGDVAELRVEQEAEELCLKIEFETQAVQPLRLYIKPTVLLLWGNQQDSPERHPPWERD